MVITERFVDQNAQPVTNAPRALQRLWAERMKVLKASRRTIAQDGRSTRAIDAEIRTLRCCIYQVQILQRGFTAYLKELKAGVVEFGRDDFDLTGLHQPIYPDDPIEGEFVEL